MKIEFKFLELLKSSMYDEDGEIDLSDMTESDFARLYMLASNHLVVPMIYDKIYKSPAFSEVNRELKAYWAGDTRKTAVRQMQRTAEFLSLYEAFLEAGVRPVIIKGIVCRELYPHPDYRISGDEDILISPESFETADGVLALRGYKRGDTDEADALHEVTYVNPERRLKIELHLTLFPEESGAYGRFNKYFEHAAESPAEIKLEGRTVYTLPCTKHLLYLVLHCAKHFMHSGFGVRQIADMALFAEAYSNDISWDELFSLLKDAGIYVFFMNVMDIAERYLGFDWKKTGAQFEKTDGIDSDDMLWDLLDSGIYGSGSEERLHSADITVKAVSGDGEGVLKSALFPPKKYMEGRYVYLKKYPVLLPWAWVCRIFSYLIKTKHKDIEKTLETGRRRTELLRKYGMLE